MPHTGAALRERDASFVVLLGRHGAVHRPRVLECGIDRLLGRRVEVGQERDAAQANGRRRPSAQRPRGKPMRVILRKVHRLVDDERGHRHRRQELEGRRMREGAQHHRLARASGVRLLRVVTDADRH
eukprot:6956062-Prymnesium_polylepis.1